MEKLFDVLKHFIPIIILGLVVGCQPPADQITEAEFNSLTEDAFKIWNEGELDLIDSHYSTDCVRSLVDIQDDVVGIEDLKTYIAGVRTVYPDFNVTFQDKFVKENRVVYLWTVTGTNTGPMGEMPPTGKEVKFSGVSVMEMEDGLIKNELVYYNREHTLKQLGFTIVPPAIPSEE